MMALAAAWCSGSDCTVSKGYTCQYVPGDASFPSFRPRFDLIADGATLSLVVLGGRISGSNEYLVRNMNKTYAPYAPYRSLVMSKHACFMPTVERQRKNILPQISGFSKFYCIDVVNT